MAGGRNEALSLSANTRLCAKGTGHTLVLKDGKIMAKRGFHDRSAVLVHKTEVQSKTEGRMHRPEELGWSPVKFKITKRRLSHADAKLEVLQAHQQSG